MHHIPRNVSVRPHQVNHCVKTFDAMLRNNLYRFFKRCASSSNFSFVRFKCLMISTNLHSSSVIQSSCMMETNCSSCWCIVLVFASHQYCFCVAKRKNVCAVYKNQAYKKRSAVKMLCSSQCWLLMCKRRFRNALLHDHPFFVLL